jgi:hypothetical protein
MTLPFFCQFFQKKSLFYGFGAVVLGLILAVCVYFPGAAPLY